MTTKNIEQLIAQNGFPGNNRYAELIETHISWVLICDEFVYKIKKPVTYSFLDFSTLAKRKFYCERELVLNRRLTENIYLDVLPVQFDASKIFIGEGNGKIIDYAVSMHKLPAAKRMDKCLLKHCVTAAAIEKLAKKISRFHLQTGIIFTKRIKCLKDLFNDLKKQEDFLQSHLLCQGLIANAIDVSNEFIRQHERLFIRRLQSGYVRDCHGDLHTRNIFLLSEPQPFDCIEFNDDFRRIDVLDEIAFLCMDLEAFGRADLADVFLEHYNLLFPVLQTKEEMLLFIYYKAYRANIRAKVNSLKAANAVTVTEKKHALQEANKYLSLMNRYIHKISQGNA